MFGCLIYQKLKKRPGGCTDLLQAAVLGSFFEIFAPYFRAMADAPNFLPIFSTGVLAAGSGLVQGAKVALWPATFSLEPCLLSYI